MKLTDLVEPGATLMVMTQTANEWSSRPLTAAKVDEDTILSLVDGSADWAKNLAPLEAVHVTLSDNRANTWLSMNALATLSFSGAEIDDLWTPAAAAYFDDGRQSVGIAVLTLACTEGRYWSTSPGRIGSLLSMVKAAISDSDTGDHGKIEL